MNFQQKIAVGVLDILLIVEICASIIIANHDPENFTPIFFKYFFAMLIPTLIVSKIAIKMLRSRESESKA